MVQVEAACWEGGTWGGPRGAPLPLLGKQDPPAGDTLHQEGTPAAGPAARPALL